MPLLQIDTNISISDTAAFTKSASAFTATLLDKPESYVMVKVRPDTQLIFAGTGTSAAHVKLKSLGLDESNTTDLSDKLCGFIEHELSIPASRIYIEFSSPARHMWGWDRRTF